MDTPNSTTRPCGKPWCIRRIPSNSTFKTCEHCRKLDQKNQQALQAKKRETKAGGSVIGLQHSAAGQKRRINQDLHSDRPSHRPKINNSLDETEDKDVLKPDEIEDITELDEIVSMPNTKD